MYLVYPMPVYLPGITVLALGVDIIRFFTFIAIEMMMAFTAVFAQEFFAGDAEGRYQTMFLELIDGIVNCSFGKRGIILDQRFIDGIYGGMVVLPIQVLQDLEALDGRLEAGFAQDRLVLVHRTF